MKLDVARLEYSADLHGKRLATVVALIKAYPSAFTAHQFIALYSATVRTYRPIRPNAGFYELVSRFFIVKVGFGKDGFAHDFLLNMGLSCA
jgi:hypothetical protein